MRASVNDHGIPVFTGMILFDVRIPMSDIWGPSFRIAENAKSNQALYRQHCPKVVKNELRKANSKQIGNSSFSGDIMAQSGGIARTFLQSTI